MKNKILITGVGGFVGNNLAEYLTNNNFGEVYGTVYNTKGNNGLVSELEERLKSKVNILGCDVTNFSQVFDVIRNVRPNIIFHMAGLTRVWYSFAVPKELFKANVGGTINVLEAIKLLVPGCKLYLPGSSEQYGLVHPEETPVKETNPLRPLSPYAVSKVAQEMTGWQYYQSYKLNIYLGRCFNIIGPNSTDDLVFATFAKQIAEIEKGKRKELSVGSLTASRDYVDVRDVCEAVWLFVNKCKVGEVYNIASGDTHATSEILEYYVSHSKSSIKTVIDEKRMRPSDVPYLLGDATKFTNTTGWKPKHKFEKTLDELLEYWRGKVEKWK